MRITISGFPGAGKSTVGEWLAERLGYEYVSMGYLRGELARRNGMTLDELNALGEKKGNEWTDKQVDDMQVELGKTRDNIIAEGRLAYFFIPNSYRIFLAVDPHEGARRILAEMAEGSLKRLDEHQYKDIDDAVATLRARVDSDKRRYKRIYGIDDYTDPKNYSLIVDTTNLDINHVCELILDNIKDFNSHHDGYSVL